MLMDEIYRKYSNPMEFSLYKDYLENNERNADGDERSGFSLHLGAESWGCVTINIYDPNAKKAWKALNSLLKGTKTSKVKDNQGFFSFLRSTKREKYGELKVW
jgi:hypothetical protein